MAGSGFKIVIIFLICCCGFLYGAELQAVDFNLMDTSINPGDDFYRYANGKWLADNQIPENRKRWGFFDLADQKTNDELITMMKEKTDDPLQNLVSDFFYSGLMNNYSFSSQLKIIDQIKTKAELSSALAYLQLIGVNPIFEIYHPAYWELRGTHYLYLKSSVPSLTDFPDNEIARQLAIPLPPSKNKYNLYSLKKLRRSFPDINWEEYFNALHLTEKKAIIEQPAYFKLINDLFNEYSIDQWQEYLRLAVINYAAGFTIPQSDSELFIMKQISSTLPDLTGHLYTRKYFSDDTRNQVDEMISNLQEAFKIRINKKDWLSKKTKRKAIRKIENFTFKIGEPDFDESEYSNLIIDDHDFLQNIFNMHRFQTLSLLKRCGSKVTKDEWSVAAFSTNAWYSTNRNNITLPAAYINQIFDPRNDVAVNYALFGTAVAHEMTHSIDDLGRRYDPLGKPGKWWKKKEIDHFNKLAEKLSDHFNSFIIIDTLTINGMNTLGENIADLGGLNIAFDAFIMTLSNNDRDIINGFSPQQRFFITFAQKWRDLLTDDLKRQYARSYYHSPPEFRTNGIVYNLDAFYQAFNLTDGYLFLEKSQRITIW